MAKYRKSAYGANPHDGANRNNASARGWGSGWPSCQGSKMAAARGGGVAVQVRREVAPLVAALLDATKKLGYDPIRGQCGGFACRAIRRSKSASNHSWGLAVDLNWQRNPMGLPFRSEIPPAVVSMWEAAGWFWGGRYRLRPDTMHFEYIGSPRDVARHLAGLGVPTPAPGPVPVPDVPGPRVLSRGDKGEDVAALQKRLRVNATGKGRGVFGPQTEAAVKRFQKEHGLVVDGVVGPKTRKALG